MTDTERLAELMAKLEAELEGDAAIEQLIPGWAPTLKGQRAAQCHVMLNALRSICMTRERYDKMHCNCDACDAVADVLALEPPQ